METDEAFELFVAEYPAGRRQRGYMTQQAFVAALAKTTLDVLRSGAKALHQVEPQYIPLMGKWLAEERWIQAPAPASNRAAGRVTEFEKLRAQGLDGLGRSRTPDWTCATCQADRPWGLRVCPCGAHRPETKA